MKQDDERKNAGKEKKNVPAENQVRGFAIAAAVCIGAALICGGVLHGKHENEERAAVQEMETVTEGTLTGQGNVLDSDGQADSVENPAGQAGADQHVIGQMDADGAGVQDVASPADAEKENSGADDETFRKKLTIADVSLFSGKDHDLIEIDYVDYEEDAILVHFLTKAEWSDPVVRVLDESGTAYPAAVQSASSEGCTIIAEGLESGNEYHFLLGGLSAKDKNRETVLTGYFEKPEIAPGA